MSCAQCNSGAMLLNTVIPWASVVVLVVSVVFFGHLLRAIPRKTTFITATLILTEELALSVWLLTSNIQFLSPDIISSVM